jgi:hypothetical protein
MQCQYFYHDNAQCELKAGRNKRNMCPSHNLITQRKEDKRKNDAKRDWTIAGGRPSRAKKQNHKPGQQQEEAPVYYDHTTPWRCGLTGCRTCKDKPSYEEYFRKKYFS